MPTTATQAIPYPVLTDTADVPRDAKAIADRLELLLAGKFNPDFIRIKLSTAISGFGAGIYTGLAAFTTEAQGGTASAFSHTSGVVTVNQTGIYVVTADITTTVTSGTFIEAKLQTITGNFILAHATGPNGDTIVNMTGVRILTTGTAIQLFLYNAAGTLAAAVDAAATPFAWSVTRLGGS